MDRRGELKQRSTAAAKAAESSSTQSSPSAATRSRQDPRTKGIPTHVVLKLIIFSVLMIIAPIGTYFWTVNRIFDGNSTYAALAAVAMTNIIMISYVCLAFLEDRG